MKWKIIIALLYTCVAIIMFIIFVSNYDSIGGTYGKPLSDVDVHHIDDNILGDL